MIDKKTMYAALIDSIGIILFFVSILLPTQPKLKLILAFIFPLICYFITDRYFKEKFWKAFWISIGLMLFLFIVITLLLIYTPLGLTLLRMVYGV